MSMASTSITLAVAHAESPLIIQADLVTLERRQASGVVDTVLGLQAHLHITFPGATKPHSYVVSRLVGERHWIQDAHFWPSGYPHFSHGFGSRCTKKYGIPAELEALLDQEVSRRGLAVDTGPDIPLRLTEPSAGPATVDADFTGDPHDRT